MAIEYRKLCEKDLDIFIEMRINQLREEGAKEDIDLKPALRDYYIRRWGFYPACLQMPITDGWELQKNFYIELLKKPKIMAVVRFKLQHLIWE